MSSLPVNNIINELHSSPLPVAYNLALGAERMAPAYARLK